MIGFIAIIVCIVFAFKTARDYGRNPFLWAFIIFCVGFGFQLVLPLVIGIVLGAIWMIGGTSPNEIQSKIEGPSFIIGIGTTILSIIAMLFILKFLGRVRDDVVMPPTRKEGSLGLND